MILNLFKYYPPKYQNTWNLAYYERGDIYFQQPAKFNDPWDCKVPNVSVPRQLKFLKDFLFYITENCGVDYSIAEWEKTKKLPRPEVRDKFKRIFERAVELLRSNMGVFSTSCIPDSELLWSHYGLSHKGYILHFEITLEEYDTNPSLKETGTPIPVIYVDKRPKWNLAAYYSNREKHICDLIKYKSSAWSYEYEIRLLNEDRYGFIKIPDSWLKSIIIGLDSDPELKDRLLSAGKELNTPVYSAEMDSSEFRVNIPGFNIDGNYGIKHYHDIIASNVLNLN